jgi:hypothetical protein
LVQIPFGTDFFGSADSAVSPCVRDHQAMDARTYPNPPGTARAARSAASSAKGSQPGSISARESSANDRRGV